MKTKFFFFAMLVSVVASAQSTVQITPISATYTSMPTIRFKVSWTSQTATNHRNKVWVFVDFQPVISPTQKGNWQPATITGTIQRTHGTISEQSNRGFFLEGTTTNFASTVTVTLTNINTAQFNWCAYATDFPPNAMETGSGGYTLKGTPPFIITTTSGTVQEPSKSFAGGTITALTDATGCPGVLCGKNGEAPGLLNCCALGNTDCSGTCTKSTNYSVTGDCSGTCKKRNVSYYDQCGFLYASTQDDETCLTGCVATPALCYNGQWCTNGIVLWDGIEFDECSECCTNSGYKHYRVDYGYFEGDDEGAYVCYCCN